MADEPSPQQQGGWTFESLLRFFTSRIDAAEQAIRASQELSQSNIARLEQRVEDAQARVEVALTAAKSAVELARTADKEAVDKAQSASDRKFESVNEFRGALSDQQRTLMPRSEAEARLQALSQRLDELKELSTRRGGESRGMDKLWGWIAGAVGLLLALYAFFTAK